MINSNSHDTKNGARGIRMGGFNTKFKSKSVEEYHNNQRKLWLEKEVKNEN